MSKKSIDVILQSLKKPASQMITVSGLYGSADAYTAAKLLGEGFFCLIIAESDDYAEDISGNIKTLSAVRNEAVTVNGVLFLSDDTESRTAVLGRLVHPEETVQYIICSKDSFNLPVAGISFIKEHSMLITCGESLSRKHMLMLLHEGGYERVDFVENPGQVAIRGEIIDVWVPGEKNPFRIVYPGEAIESIRVFDVGTQRSQEFLDSVFLFPVQEQKDTTLMDYIEACVPGSLVLFDGTGDSIESGRHARWQKIIRTEMNEAEYQFDFQSVTNFQKNIVLFGNALREWKNNGFRTIIFSRNTGEMERLQELLYEHCRDIEQYPQHRIDELTCGFISPGEKIACIANGDIFGRYHKTFRMPRWTGGRILHSLGDIGYGDYVVHEKYGIGQYRGLEEIQTKEHEGEYIKIEYKGNDYLYVPVDDFQQVQKYVGGEGYRPRLFSLDGIAWERVKQKVKKAVMELAGELIRTQASRVLKEGYNFSPITHMEHEFADSFMYPETPDQARTIQEVFNDMQNPRPMDRIVCGDVGYGKTEVAMRAAFKAVNDSCQVAVLVPTTILAEQHYQTFSERMADYPVSIGFISRFQSKTEQKKILNSLKLGTIDIIIGTHRLLQKDVQFKNLKLLIIDEEHRFGVKHKERFKKQFAGIDILTLSATPIPRTLHMGLSGVKELSLIETPPEGRQPIQTYVGEIDESIITKAITSELSRGGQVFYVHNLVETIESCAAQLKRLLPSVKFAQIHGQMRPSVIEKTMWSFMHREIDCLVATSIIESGLDIPNVNTLIIENAQNMGLAQLYQLRGRVGRSQRRAQCFLFYSDKTGVTDEAQKRLKALREFTSLSSGFNLAMRDLEIRGGGNILGARQSGFMRDVGFDLYSRLLKKEIERQRTGESQPEEEPVSVEGPKIDLKIPAFFPQTYIPNDSERIRMYRKSLEYADNNTLRLFEQELRDRFGTPPLPAKTFLELLSLRQDAVRLRITAISEKKRQIEIHFHKNHTLIPDKIVQLAGKYGDTIRFIERNDAFVMCIAEEAAHGADWLGWIKKFLSEIR